MFYCINVLPVNRGSSTKNKILVPNKIAMPCISKNALFLFY